jgi:predicted dehydrogenase
MAMIGGGKDAFIGAIHRFAFNMDAQVELVAGALSINPEIAVDSGKSLFLDESRIYTDYKVMLEKEAAMPKDKRIDFVSIVTPNFVHFDPAMMALDKGFNVVIEKPITFSLEQAKQLKEKGNTNRIDPFTYSYLYRLPNDQTGKTNAEEW